MRNFLEGWFEKGLNDWDISRDGPYFGFKIPGEDDKYFYVWLDAPVGYVSLTERALHGAWQDRWQDPATKIVHFIGKDILYFHTLFWPAMLMATGDTLPSKIQVHGMLTVGGEKMSKARGTFILGDDFADAVDPQALRYYYAAKLTPKAEDIDLSFVDFTNRVNADLVNNVVNLLSRTVPQLHKHAAGKPGVMFESGDLLENVARLGGSVEKHYRDCDFAGAMRIVVEMGSLGNKFLQDQAPWDVAKTDPVKARALLSTALWIGKCCIALLKPVVPVMAETAERMLRLPPFTFENALDALPVDVEIGAYERLMDRLDLKKVETLQKPAEGVAPEAAKPAKEAKAKEAPAKKGPVEKPAEIEFDDFHKIEMRAAKVLTATAVEGSDKLILVQLDVGEKGKRQVFSGLRPHVQPEQLVGKTVVVVCNLKPRKMGKFGISEGMIVAAGDVPVPLSAEGAAPGALVS
jgi:methionyl-tRNA synthetase